MQLPIIKTDEFCAIMEHAYNNLWLTACLINDSQNRVPNYKYMDFMLWAFMKELHREHPDLKGEYGQENTQDRKRNENIGKGGQKKRPSCREGEKSNER